MTGDTHNVYISCKCVQILCLYANLDMWCLISAGEPHNKHFWPRMLSLLHNRNCELLFNHSERKLYIMHQRVVINAVMYNTNGNVSQQCISTAVVFESAQNFAQNVHCCWKALAMSLLQMLHIQPACRVENQASDQSINQSKFYSANIPGEARLSGATAISVFKSKNVF